MMRKLKVAEEPKEPKDPFDRPATAGRKAKVEKTEKEDASADDLRAMEMAKAEAKAELEAKDRAVRTAIESGDREAAKAAARAGLFENVNAAKERPMPDQMAKIVTASFVDEGYDLAAEHQELEALLDTSSETARQANALEQAERNARRAFRLLVSYREMFAAWEADNSVFFGSMWDESSRALQAEKDAGKRSKQITDRDVEMNVAVMFPDEYRSVESKRLRAKQTEKSLEHLVEMWGSKCRSLNALVGKGR